MVIIFQKSRQKQPISKILFLKSYQNQGSKPPDLDKQYAVFVIWPDKKEQDTSMCTGRKVLLELNESLCD